MARRTRSKHPEYIQLRPYRALVGVPVHRRPGKFQAFVLGAMKGVAWAILPVFAAVFAFVYFTQGSTDAGTALALQGPRGAVAVAIIALLTGVISAARH